MASNDIVECPFCGKTKGEAHIRFCKKRPEHLAAVAARSQQAAEARRQGRQRTYHDAQGESHVRLERIRQCQYCDKMISSEHGNFDHHLVMQHTLVPEAKILIALQRWERA